MKHKLTRLTSLFLALIMSFSMLLVPANAAFSDVPEKAWYAEAVDYVQAHEWMKGVSENSFAPNAEVTRAMFVTVLARYAGAQLADEQQTQFDDVPSGTWYTGAVAWAAEKGIVNGVSANAFAPNRAISRQELCTMLARFINKQGYELKEGEAKSFTDVASIAGFAKDAVAYCARTGLVAGYTDGSFRPTATASRAMTATLLMRLDKSIQGENEPPIPMPARTLSSEVDGLTVTMDAPEGALPEDAVMTVTKIENLNAVQAAVDALEDVQGTALVAADITFFHEGKEFQPKKEVTVTMTSAELPEEGELAVVHLDTTAAELEDSEVEAEPVNDVTVEPNAVTFEVDSFSVYAVIGDVIIDKDEDTLTFETDDYEVTVTYTKEAQIPVGARLTVSEIPYDSEAFEDLWDRSLAKLNENATVGSESEPDTRKGIASAVFFDITLSTDAGEFEPAAPLEVHIHYKNGGQPLFDGEAVKIVHFKDNGTTELIDKVAVDNAGSTWDGMPDGVMANDFVYTQDGFSKVGVLTTDVFAEPVAVASVAPVQPFGEGDDSIAADKTVTDTDGDGIYDLELSVVGNSQSSQSTEIPKTNVILIIDRSGSMDDNTYIKYTYNVTGTYSSSNYYYSNASGSNGNRLYHDANGWYYTTGSGFWTTRHDYTGDVYWRVSRLQATKIAANDLVHELLANNDSSNDEKKDIVEISLITFNGPAYTGGDTSNDAQVLIAADSNNTYNETNIKNTINGITAAGGTDWEAALQAAIAQALIFKRDEADEDVAVIFLTDGEPTVHVEDADGSIQNSWNAAKDEARTIATDYTLYNIMAYGSSSNTRYLRALTNYAYGQNVEWTNNQETEYTRNYFFDAKDTSALQEAFEVIASNISNSVGFGGVAISDGVSLGATNTSATIGGHVNTNAFTYTVYDGTRVLYFVKFNGDTATFTINGQEYTATTQTVQVPITDEDGNVVKTISAKLAKVTVDGVDYMMAPATMDDKGQLEWELAALGVLKNYKYVLSMQVWPNQVAYDIAADLNNGIYADIDAALEAYGITGDEAAQIKASVKYEDGTYNVYTNYSQSVRYYEADEETVEQEGQDPVTTITYGEEQSKPLPKPDPIQLQGSSMTLRKGWEAELSEGELNELLYNGDGTPTKYQITLRVWKAETEAALAALVDEGDYEKAYKTVILGWDEDTQKYVWEKSLGVAPGMMLSLNKAQSLGLPTDKQVTYEDETYCIIEDGHYYYVTEDNTDLHFELNTHVYHPMIVNGKLHDVFFAGTTVTDMIPLTEVLATNTLKGGLNVRKVVTEFDEETVIEGVEDEFAFILTIWNEDNGTISPVYTYNEQFGDDYKAISGSIGYREFGKITNEATGERETLGRNVIIFEDTLNAPQKLEANKRGTNDPVYATKTADNKTQIILRMPANGEIRLVNLPAGTKYTVKEILDLADGYYLIGPNGWSVYDILPNQMFVPNSSNPGEYMLSTTLTEGDEFKVVEVKDGNINAWYPGGDSANYHVNATGPVTIYFRSSYNDGWAQNGGFFWVGNPVEAPAPDDSETVYTYFKTESYLKGKVEDPEGEGSSSGEVAEVLTGTTTSNTVSGSITGNKANIETYYNKTKAVFYVYHSSDNTVEKISFSDNRVKGSYDAVNNKYEYTFNIYNEVYPSTVTINGTSYNVKFLYGGYYHDYKGKSSENFDAAADGLEYVNNKYTDVGGHAYTLDYIKTSEKQAWKDCEPYTVNGKEMVPVQNEVYYLKEVPTAYLQPYTYFTYKLDESQTIQNLWAISALDDLNYTGAGFYIQEKDEPAKNVVSSLKIRAAKSNTTVTLTAMKLFNPRNGMKDGYLSYKDITTDYLGKDITLQQYWKTPDGIEVRGFVQRQLDTTGKTKESIDSTDSLVP